MTSKPEGTAPGTGAGPRAPAGQPGLRATAGQSWPHATARQPWPLVVTITLLIILGLAGLRGAVTTPRWNGPLRHDGPVVGLALEAVLGVLLVITLRRRSAALNAAAVRGGEPPDSVAAKLRTVLTAVLAVGMVAVAVAIVIGLHLHAFSAVPVRPPVPVKIKVSSKARVGPGLAHSSSIHIPLTAVLYALLIAVLVAGVLLSVWWSRRFGLPGRSREDGFVVEDSEDLREAVESGRSALRSIDDARAAIIACYVAMENSLAERGTARAVADTPDELLARATRSGVVRGTAAARLTALFYEARFSSHPLGRAQRDAAERALDELAAALADAGPGDTALADAGPGPARATEAGATEAGAGP
jgi:hypothetical protein